MMECKKALVACESDVAKASEYLRKKGLASAEKKASRIAAEGLVGSYVHDGRIGVLIEVNCETDFVSRGDQFKELVADMGMQVVACPSVEVVTVEDVPAEFVAKEKEIESEKDDLAKKPPQIREKIVDGRVAKRLAELALLEQPYIRDDKILVKDLVKQTIAGLGEKVQIRRFVRYNLGEGLQKKSTDFAAEVAAQTAATVEAKPAVPQAPEVKEEKIEDSTPKVAVSAARVKELREATGAGMMDCKKALAACENNVEKATEFLRKKGLASAEKKAGRVASEGLIGSYIHDGRIGVLIEVNSETDFVARSETFKELVADLAMQVVACPQVQYVSVEDIPSALVEKETEIELGKEDLATKPEAIRGKIVEGRVAKMMAELVLLEQPYIRNDKILVKDLVKQTVATLGENIQVRRFTRFNLGEGIEKRSIDFAAEVAAQTGASA
jgi:elongation factor Ts